MLNAPISVADLICSSASDDHIGYAVDHHTHHSTADVKDNDYREFIVGPGAKIEFDAHIDNRTIMPRMRIPAVLSLPRQCGPRCQPVALRSLPGASANLSIVMQRIFFYADYRAGCTVMHHFPFD